MNRKEDLISKLAQQPLQRETLGSQIYRALRQAILNETYEGGERLTQEELATNFGTSRIPVRDALRMLEADGLVVADSGGYSVVSFGPEDVMEVYAIRALLEPYAAHLATNNLTNEQYDSIVKSTERMTQALTEDDFEAFAEENTALHMTLYEACNLPRLVRIIESLWIGRPPLTPLQVPEQASRSVKEHRELLRALERRDANRVRELIEEHIVNARDALLKLYAKEGETDS